MKKRLVILFIICLLASMLSACNKSENNDTTSETGNIDTSKEVKLKMYLLGDRSADFDLVYDEVNKILKEKVNVTLEVSFLSWAEHETKYSLLFSSGEDFDLIFTASGWGHYETTAVKKGFYEMTEDFIKSYAPNVWSIVPSDAWIQAQINKKVYMIPNYQKEYGVDLIGVRGDLMKKYGIDKIESKEELEAYFDAIVENETGISPLASKGGGLQYPYQFQSRGYEEVKGTPGQLFLYEYVNADNLDIVSVIDTPEFLEYAKKMNEMYKKGYWSSDSLSSNATREDNWQQGKSAAMVWNLGAIVNNAREINEINPDWEMTFIDIAPNVPKRVNPYTNNGIAINAASKNPERAMMVINELMTNKEIYDLTSIGIEGVHYEAVGDKQYIPLDAAERYPANGNCNWGWTNTDIRRELYVENPDAVYMKQQETLEKWNETSVVHIYDTFAFNEENVKTEVALINTVVTQYLIPIHVGMVDNVEAAVEDLKDKLNQAGIQKVYDELKKQAEEFVKDMQ